jgi:hypothetical protein
VGTCRAKKFKVFRSQNNKLRKNDQHGPKSRTLNLKLNFLVFTKRGTQCFYRPRNPIPNVPILFFVMCVHNSTLSVCSRSIFMMLHPFLISSAMFLISLYFFLRNLAHLGPHFCSLCPSSSFHVHTPIRNMQHEVKKGFRTSNSIGLSCISRFRLMYINRLLPT